VLDPTLGGLGTQLEALKRELELYDPELMAKESAIIVNKVDTPNLQASKFITPIRLIYWILGRT